MSYIGNEIETVEQMKPNPELIAMTKRVMDQNDAILRMNGRLLDMLTSPILLVRKESPGVGQGLREGE